MKKSEHGEWTFDIISKGDNKFDFSKYKRPDLNEYIKNLYDKGILKKDSWYQIKSDNTNISIIDKDRKEVYKGLL